MKKALAFLALFSPVALAALGWHLYGPLGLLGALLGVALTGVGVRSHLLPLIEYGPLRDANGKNKPLYVQIDPTVPYYKAVLAQEVWESIHKTNPINLIRSRTKKGQRDMELMGHEVEVQAAVLLYGITESTYRRIEAETMQRGYGGIFKGVDVETEMAKLSGKARAWVVENKGRFG